MLSASQPQERLAQIPRAARLAVIALFVISGLIFASWVVHIPDIKARLRLSDAQLGLALLGAPAGVVLGQVLIGWTLRRWGSRLMSILMAVAFCASFPLLGLAPNLPTLIALVFLYGLCGGGLDVATNAQAAIVERQYGRPLMSSFHGMWSLAGLVGAAVGGLLAGRGIGAEPHFLGVVAVALVLLALAAPWLVADRQPLAEASPTFTLPPRALLPLGVIAFSVLLCEGAMSDWSGVYLRDSLASPPALATAGFVAFSLAMTAGRLGGDWLTLRLGPARIVRGGGVLIVVGIGLIFLAPAPLVAIVGFGLVGAGVACPFPLVLSAASRLPQIDPGRAIAAMATVGYTGSFLGPPVIGSLAELISLRGALGLLSLIGIVVLLVGGRVGQPDRAAE